MAFDDLILAHEGARIVVMGGSSSLAADIDGLDADVWLSANEHGAKLRAVDYLVAMDHEHGGLLRPMDQVLRQYSDAPIISPERYGDIHPYGWPGAPRRIYTGLVAAWIAYMMGARVVILAGFDGYGGQPGYRRKARLFEQGIPVPVREVGGRIGVWPAYDSNERFRFRLAPQIETFLGGDGWTWVEAVKPTTLADGPLAAGERRHTRRDAPHVRTLLQHGVLREISDPEGMEHGENHGNGAEKDQNRRQVAA